MKKIASKRTTLEHIALTLALTKITGQRGRIHTVKARDRNSHEQILDNLAMVHMRTESTRHAKEVIADSDGLAIGASLAYERHLCWTTSNTRPLTH